MPTKSNHENTTIKVRKEVKEALDLLNETLGYNKIDMYSAILAYWAIGHAASRHMKVFNGSRYVKQLESGLDLETIRQLERDRVKFTDEENLNPNTDKNS